MKQEKEKIVLAYSGGLDTSVAIAWLKNKGYDVIACCIDVGEGKDLEAIKAKGSQVGAYASVVIDAKEDFAENFVLPALQSNAMYEQEYPLVSALSRPLIVQKLVAVAKEYGATAIAHGCTGKGNDQVRFELAIKAFAPEMPIIAPWRTWELKSRDDEIDYAQAHQIPLKINRETNYSKDKNLWHLSHEGLDLEDPQNEPKYDEILEMGVTPEQAPDTPTYITLTFESGIPTALNGEKLGGQAMVTKLNEIGGANGIGLIDMVENRLVGMKSRGVYETPGGTILYKAHQLLESITLDKETMHYKQGVAIKFGEILYNGQWFTPLREALSAFVDKVSENVSGEVKLKLYKGNITPASITSPYTLYSEQIASFGEDDSYDQNDSAGFINLFGLPIKVAAMQKKTWNKK